MNAFPQNSQSQPASPMPNSNPSRLTWLVGMIAGIGILAIFAIWMVKNGNKYSSVELPPDNTEGYPTANQNGEDPSIQALTEVTPDSSISAIQQDIANTNLDSLDLELEAIDNTVQGS